MVTIAHSSPSVEITVSGPTAMTSTPTIRVEIAFGHGAYSTPSGAQWIDVTEDVLEIQTQRGRQSEFDQFPAGTALVTLVNDDRTYDPLNTAGAYYGDLVANVPIRVVATRGAVDYHIWRGYVDGWPARYTDAGYRSEVQVQCTDAFRLLAERKMADTHVGVLDNLITSDPVTWYACDSTDDSQIMNLGTVGKPFTTAASISSVDPLSRISNGALQLPAQTSIGDTAGEISYAASAPVLLDSRDNPTAGTTFTVSALIQTNEVKDKGILHTLDSIPRVIVEFMLYATGGVLVARLSVNTDSGLGPDNTVNGTINLADGLVHHVVGVRNGTTLSVYVDGALDASSTVGGASGSQTVAPGVMQLGRGWVPAGGASGIVAVDEIMVWQEAINANQVSNLYAEFVNGPWTPALSGQTVTDILDEIGWPASLRDLDVGEVYTQVPSQPAGMSALGLLQSTADTEAGRLFIDAQGRVVFHGRSRFVTETVENTVQYTFSGQNRDVSPSGVGLLDGTLSITVDDRLTFDAAEITRVGGKTQRSSSTATPARTYSATGLLATSDTQALALADWVVFRYGTALPRSESWEVDPETMPDDWDNILTLDIGHRIKHDITPGGIGSSINLEQHLSYIAHDITPDRWVITMNGTPTDPNGNAYFLWATVVTADNDNGWADTDGDPPGGYWA